MSIIVLSGSMRFVPDMDEVERKLILQGHTPIGVSKCFDEDAVHGETKVALDALHLRKIDMADLLYVVDVDGYIGHSTQAEIAYAESIGVPVTYHTAVDK